MSILNMIRAWKDEEYRASLTEEERKLLPEHPAGMIELREAELEKVGGALRSRRLPRKEHKWTCF